MNTRMTLAILAVFSICAGPSYAMDCSKHRAEFEQGQKDGAADAREGYPKNVHQHGYPASASDGKDGKCYRSAYKAAYDNAKNGSKGAAAAAAAPAPQGRTFTQYVFSPADGVICDTYGVKYCADGTGISASFTDEYLGPDAARKLGEYMAGADTSSFVLSNKIECRVKEKACFKGKGSMTIDPVFTRILFP